MFPVWEILKPEHQTEAFFAGGLRTPHMQAGLRRGNLWHLHDMYFSHYRRLMISICLRPKKAVRSVLSRTMYTDRAIYRFSLNGPKNKNCPNLPEPTHMGPMQLSGSSLLYRVVSALLFFIKNS